MAPKRSALWWGRRPRGRAALLLLWVPGAAGEQQLGAGLPAGLEDAEGRTLRALVDLVRPGARNGPAPDFQALRTALEQAQSHGLLALLHLFGLPDSQGRLLPPHGLPRDIPLALEYAVRGASSVAVDRWSFTALGLLFSLGYPPLQCVRLEVLDGPSVRFVGLDDAVKAAFAEEDGGGRAPKCERCGARGDDDLAGAAYWVAAERGEPLGAVAFASLLRRNLTDVPNSWGGRPEPALARAPAVLVGAPRAAQSAELACRAIGTLVGPAGAASGNEEPLLDKAALTWKAWRHRARRLPAEPDWRETKEYVDSVRFRAEQLQEPQAQRELGAVHYEGHAEAGVEQSRASATSHWEAAARQGDVWSAWYTALVTVQDGRPEDAHEFLDLVAEAQAGALSLMAMHFKFRFGLGVPKSPERAGLFLKGAADLGYSNAQLILAHAYVGHTHGHMSGVHPPGGPNSTMALLYYKAAAANGRLAPKFNVALLTAQGSDPEVVDPHQRCLVAYKHFSEVVLRAHSEVHVVFAHARRAFDLGDEAGALLRFALLSDAGASNAHLNAAYLWDRLAASGGAAVAAAPLQCWSAGSSRASGAPRSSSSSSSTRSAAHECAFHYHRRAASIGHVASMHELSARHLEGTRVPAAASRPADASRAAYGWTALAAELGDSRGVFDLAYLTQYGIGCTANESRALELYRQLLRDGDWPARIAALSGLGLHHLRTYFLQGDSALSPVAGYLREFGAWLGGGLAAGWRTLTGGSAASARRESMLDHVVIKDRFEGGAAHPPASREERGAGADDDGRGREEQGVGRRSIGRLLFEVARR